MGQSQEKLLHCDCPAVGFAKEGTFCLFPRNMCRPRRELSEVFLLGIVNQSVWRIKENSAKRELRWAAEGLWNGQNLERPPRIELEKPGVKQTEERCSSMGEL